MSTSTVTPELSSHDARSELRGVIAMAVPTVLTMTARALIDVVDYKLVSMLGDPAAAAAILPAQMIVWCYIVLGMGTINLVGTYVAQSLGREKYDECGAYGWQAAYLAAIFGLATVPLIPFLRLVMHALTPDATVFDAKYAYGSVAILSVAPTIAAEGFAQFFNGVHRPWVTMWSSLEANVVNVLVGATLMFGWFGVEPIGVAGAAWGTVAGTSFRTLRLALTMRTRDFDVRFATRRTWRPSWSRMRDVVRLGLPTGVQWLSDVFVWMVFVNALIGRFSTAHQIASNSAWQFMRLSFMPTAGVGIAVAALVGKSIGRGDFDRPVREVRGAMALVLAYMGALTVLFAAAPKWLLSFYSDDPEVLRIGVGVMICAAVFQLFDGLAITYISALRGAGDTFVPSAFSIVAHWVIIMGGGYAAVRLFPRIGSLGPWIVASILIIVIGVYMALRWRGGRWKRIRIFRDDAPTAPAGSPSA
ncbi:MAG: MATE family efflux transporter [Planctomycetota bacterium]|nr:MAG: MATE family efflux transporter [Planctomycetota bacterium]